MKMKRDRFIKIIGFGALGLSMAPVAFAKSIYKKCDKQICQTAWEKLCGNIGKVYKTDAFNYVHPKKRLPHVFIYGDSISIAYSATVMSVLKNKANVYRLFKNGGSSGHFISNMNQMNEAMFQPYLDKGWKFQWDVIHFNVGLHDLKYLKGKHLNKKGKQVSSISLYKDNLHCICQYLKRNYPEAKLIFSTTTPVPENAKGRFEGDSLIYNKAAMDVLLKHPDIVINDLYTFTKPHLEEWAQAPGNVHYKALGYSRQGQEVARVIAENL